MPSSSKYSVGRKGLAARAKTVELKLPSLQVDEDGHETTEHNVCLVRVPDPLLLITAGLLDDFDELTALVGTQIETIDGKSKASAEVIKKLAGMTDQLTKGMQLVDRLCEMVIVEPAVVWPVVRWTTGEQAGQPVTDRDGKFVMLGPDERDNETLYTDEIDLEDRMFILQFSVGGVSDPAQFRQEYADSMAGVADVASLPLSAFGTPPHS